MGRKSPAVQHSRPLASRNKGGQMSTGRTSDTSHTLSTALTPPTLTHIKKKPLSHTLTAAHLVARRLHRLHFCSVSCYKTTLSACVASPGLGATGETRRHFYLPCEPFFVCGLPVYLQTFIRNAFVFPPLRTLFCW